MAVTPCCSATAAINRSDRAHLTAGRQLLLHIDRPMPMAVLQRQPLVTELTVCPNLDELTDRPGRPQHLELDHRTRRSQPSLDQRTRHRVHLRVTQPHQRALVSEVPRYRSHAEDIVASSARSGDPPACNRLRSRRRVAPPTPPPQPTLAFTVSFFVTVCNTPSAAADGSAGTPTSHFPCLFACQAHRLVFIQRRSGSSCSHRFDLGNAFLHP